MNFKPTGEVIHLPFYPGARYAAIPGTRFNGKVQVEYYPARPVSLVYHEHSFHLFDLKVILSKLSPFKFFLLRVSKISNWVQWGR